MKYIYIILTLTILISYSCAKETYDLGKLSKKAEVSPVLAIPVFKGSVVLDDAVKESDTVVYDDDKFVRLVYRKDSIINLDLEDYIDVENLVKFRDTYTVGEIVIDPFQGTLDFTLDEVSKSFSPALRSQFLALDDGADHPFPDFPAVTLGNKTFSSFLNFEHVKFFSGSLDISLTNNFTAPITGVQVVLSSPGGPLGTVTLSSINPGQTQSASLDLTGKEMTNLVTASVTLTGSEGNATPGLINLFTSNILMTARGRDLKVVSGRVIIPYQLVSDPESSDTIAFDPGDDIELDRMKVNSGTMNWNATFNGSMDAILNIILPTIQKNIGPINEVITLSQSNVQGSLDLERTEAEFNADPDEPFNKVPIVYSLNVSSNNEMVDFDSSNKVDLEVRMTNPGFDLIKGYFGQKVEIFEPESLDLGIEEYLGNNSGTISLTNPSIRINYLNSFAIPIEIKFNGQGRRLNKTADLALQPFIVKYPAALAERDISATLSVNKENSSLPQLISLPPESVVFSGSAGLNPGGDPDHLRNNYLFGNSRLLASVEMELPLELSMKNFQLSDTTENYLSDEDLHGNQGIDDLELVTIGLNIKNGFPFDVEASVSLYDSRKMTVNSTVNASGLVKAAKVDANGRVNEITESVSTIEVTREFLDNIEKSDQLIFNFKASTTESKNVKIYSDYRIDFNVTAHLITKIQIDL